MVSGTVELPLTHDRTTYVADHKPAASSSALHSEPIRRARRAASGGGRASARETIGRVAAGAIAEKWLKEKYGVEIVSWVRSGHRAAPCLRPPPRAACPLPLHLS